MRRNGFPVQPIHRDCKVTYSGGGKFEVESSFLVKNNPTPIRYTVLIVEGVIDEAQSWLVGKKEKMKLHGYHEDFVLI